MATFRMFSAMQTFKPTIFNFWHSGTLALRADRRSAQMSEIENGIG